MYIISLSREMLVRLALYLVYAKMAKYETDLHTTGIVDGCKKAMSQSLLHCKTLPIKVLLGYYYYYYVFPMKLSF
jgi:hypothetical protein